MSAITKEGEVMDTYDWADEQVDNLLHELDCQGLLDRLADDTATWDTDVEFDDGMEGMWIS